MDTTLEEKESSYPVESEQDEDPTGSCVDDEAMEPFHSKISKEIIPKLGMEFETEDAAYDFYNTYAFMVGFSVRKSAVHRYRGTVLDRVFVCSCQGKRGPDKRDVVYTSHREETRVGCLARLKISCRHKEKYRVVNFFSKHNHSLAGPGKTHLFRSHRKVSASQASDIDMVNSSSDSPRSDHEVMARQARSSEILGFSGVDSRNYLHKKRSLEMKRGDAGVILAYLQTMKVEDPNLFYAIQVDVDDLITNIVWVDARMMIDYEDFGDVVCLDTTHCKHQDGRPFALFVGMNHHKKITIFGVALLYDQTSESFMWLFDTFSRVMGGKLPKTVLTDDDDAISETLAVQWPETCHRFCIWHVFQNATIHLSPVFARYEDFSRDFSTWIYDCEHEEDFVNAWSELLDKYELQNNDWLKRMFSIKEKWATLYGRETFCADMNTRSTTQQVDNMNEVIKYYVNYKHDFKIFFEKFQQLLSDHRYDEMVQDIKSNQGEMVLSFPIAILKHAASFYTPQVIQSFQEECYKAYDSHLEVYCEMEAFVKYKVTPFKKHYSFVVSFDKTQTTICCTCRKYEFCGLLCSHILKVFSFRRVMEVPSKYILKRWTKKAKRGINRAYSESSAGNGDPKTAMERHRDISRLCMRLITRAAEFEGGYNFVKDSLLILMREVDLSSTKRAMQSKRPKHSKSHDESMHCLIGNNVQQHSPPHLAQENQTDGSVPQQSVTNFDP